MSNYYPITQEPIKGFLKESDDLDTECLTPEDQLSVKLLQYELNLFLDGLKHEG